MIFVHQKRRRYRAQKSVRYCGSSWCKVSLEGMYFKELLEQMDARTLLERI